MISKLSQGPFNAVYFVESQDSSEEQNLIAIRPHIHDGHIEWEDTSRGTAFVIYKLLIDGKTLNESTNTPLPTPNLINITTRNGKSYNLIKLTKKLFDDVLKKEVNMPEQLPVFQTDEDVQNYYLNKNFMIYE